MHNNSLYQFINFTHKRIKQNIYIKQHNTNKPTKVWKLWNKHILYVISWNKCEYTSKMLMMNQITSKIKNFYILYRKEGVQRKRKKDNNALLSRVFKQFVHHHLNI